MHETLAQQSMKLFDQRGEFAMIPFLMQRASAEPPASDWRIYGFCLMADHTLVIHQDGEYTFTWTAPDGAACIYTRPAAMKSQQRPDTAPVDTALFTKPDFQSVWNYVIEDIETDLGFMLPSPIISNQTSFQAAPSLYTLIQEAVANRRKLEASITHTPESDDAIASCAKQVAQQLPKLQQDQLVAACRRALRTSRTNFPSEQNTS